MLSVSYILYDLKASRLIAKSLIAAPKFYLTFIIKCALLQVQEILCVLCRFEPAIPM
jgi:hypothetical protein